MMQTSLLHTVIEPKPLALTVELLASALASGEVGAGDTAILKRMEIHQRPSVAFMRIAYRYLPEQWENQTLQWMAITAGMAWMNPHSHNKGSRVGQVLAEHGYSEIRLERLLSADQAVLPMMLMRAAYFLSARQSPVDWTEFASLLLVEEQDECERIRLAIARDFYRPRSARHKKP